MTTLDARIRQQQGIHRAAQTFLEALPAEHREVIWQMAEKAECEPWQIIARSLEEMIARYLEGLGSTAPGAAGSPPQAGTH